MKNKLFIWIVTLFLSLILQSCEDFVDIDSPNFQMVTEDVYSNEKTTIAAIKGIYNQLYAANFSTYGISVLGGISGDLLIARTDTYLPFDQHELFSINTSDASYNQNIWGSAYNIIYLTNRALEGLKSAKINSDLRANLRGQVLFIRSFVYFYLASFYGDVPLLLTSNYEDSSVAPRNPINQVWKQIEADLDEAIKLLNKTTEYKEDERYYVNRFVAEALRARVYLYQEDWENAELFSSKVINRSELYLLEMNPDHVFLANSKEAIWQIAPDGVNNFIPKEANQFVLLTSNTGASFTGRTSLAEDFVRSFSIPDKRNRWIGKVSSETEQAYFAEKYWFKRNGSLKQYSMVMRLAEQYLIRAEARVKQNKLDGAIDDLDRIRNRAGIKLIADIKPNITQQVLLDSILLERKRELFSEWGHRWLDLRRTGKINEIFKYSSTWQSSDVLYPIPGEERLKNPFLTQNEGYDN